MARADKARREAGEGTALVIVESPAKASTIKKYLGDRFLVEASVGHVRDLAERKSDLPENDPRRNESWVKYGVNIANHFDPLEEIYIVNPDRKRQVDALKQALAKADKLYLATDDDREGEAISWHLLEVLRPKVPVERLVFHEITREAIDKALHNTRRLNENLVASQRARRIVDRLFGWDVSQKVLWRKIKPGLSAGRVQSVALRLLVDRERERMAFVSSAYWDLTAKFAKDGEGFEATLQKVADRKVATGRDFDDKTGKLVDAKVLQLDEAAANALAARLAGRAATVTRTEVKPQTMRPYPPFTTSTLQQEGSRKLRWTASQTMQVAQRLYESGFITYMRTDSVTLSDQALQAARTLIGEQYGQAYLPDAPRRYVTKSANAQEAHEAIRPAGTRFPTIQEVERELGREAMRLYELIWKRTVASQMVDAQVEQTSVDIQVEDATFRASGRVTRFPGFLKAYVEGSDDPEAALSDRDTTLPTLKSSDKLGWGEPPLQAHGHETRPPARFTDASLVKALEENGIGRPSTYASILRVLLEREYTFRRGNALVPTFMGMAVVQMLEKHMPHLVDYNFTAEMEARLDAIARGEDAVGHYLRSFYEDGFRAQDGHGAIPGLVALLAEVGDHIDPADASSIKIGTTEAGDPAVVRIGRYGTFVKVGDRTANVPDDVAPDELTVGKLLELIEAKEKGEAPLGQDPKTDEPVFLRNGRFGWYLQRGVAKKEEGAEKPKMVSLSKSMKPEEVTLAVALKQLELPRTLGNDPNSGQPVVAHVGRYGDYIKVGEESRTLPGGMLAADVTLEQALAVLKQPKASVKGKEHVRDIGVRASDGKMLAVWVGRWGPYVSDGEVNKTLPKDSDPTALTVEQADELLKSAAEARTGKVLGKDPASGREVRLLDGRFGPYLTDGETNASLARGADKEALTLEDALDRLKHFGKPVKKKPGRRGTTARKASGEAKAAPKAKAASKNDTGAKPKTAAKTGAKTATSKAKATKTAAKPKAAETGKPAPPPPPAALVVSARSQKRGGDGVAAGGESTGETAAAGPSAVVRRRPAPTA